MTAEKIKYVFTDFKEALQRLHEAVNEDMDQKGNIVIDGTIQRFEFTFELSWKLMKAVLHFRGIECTSPREVIKEGFQKTIIENGQAWIDMLEDRNKTSHLYDRENAEAIYRKIKQDYVILFNELETTVSDIIEKNI